MKGLVEKGLGWWERKGLISTIKWWSDFHHFQHGKGGQGTNKDGEENHQIFWSWKQKVTCIHTFTETRSKLGVWICNCDSGWSYSFSIVQKLTYYLSNPTYIEMKMSNQKESILPSFTICAGDYLDDDVLMVRGLNGVLILFGTIV